ncbi:MAG: DUF86 domain-containing protein [Rubrobacter sp.]|nr:DUF86 domain-containing protein [Rubrobacter sp.]
MIIYRPRRWFITQPCAQMAGFRNRSVHEYAEVDTEIVWAIVQNEVPPLLENFESLLKESGHGG